MTALLVIGYLVVYPIAAVAISIWAKNDEGMYAPGSFGVIFAVFWPGLLPMVLLFLVIHYGGLLIEKVGDKVSSKIRNERNQR